MGSIKAGVISVDDLIELGSVAEARANGKARLEDKDYDMQDGRWWSFLHSLTLRCLAVIDTRRAGCGAVSEKLAVSSHTAGFVAVDFWNLIAQVIPVILLALVLAVRFMSSDRP